MDNLNYLVKNGGKLLIDKLIEYEIITSNDVIEALIKNGDPDDILKYIESSYIFPLDKLANAIIATKDAYYIYDFARDSRYEVPIVELANALIATKNAEYIYLFAKDIASAPINKLADAIIATKDAKYIYLFARNVAGAPINTLADGIVATKNVEYIYKFALDVKNAPVNILADGIVATKNVKYIYKFAKDVKNAPINILANGIAASKNEEYISKFAKNIASAPIAELANAIIATQDAGVIYRFAYDVANIPINILNILTDAISTTKDAYYIYEFARVIPNVPLGKLIKALKDLQSYDYLINCADLTIRNTEILEIIADIIITTNDIDLLNKLKKCIEERLPGVRSEAKVSEYNRTTIASYDYAFKMRKLVQDIESIYTKIEKAIKNIESNTDILKLKYILLYNNSDSTYVSTYIQSHKEELKSLLQPAKEKKLVR